jgi:hypothetical protein
MNLEEELRAVLSQEAEMRTTPTPDIEGMVKGGQDRVRDRRAKRIGLAAAAVLLIGGGVYGVAQLGDADADADSGVTSLPTGPTEPTQAADPPYWAGIDGAPVEPGTYRTLVAAGAQGKDIQADLTVHGSGWIGSNFPVAYDGEEFAGIGVYHPESVAGGCKMAAGLEPAAGEPQQLVQQLTQMPRSEIVQQPTPTHALGRSAVHLRLQVAAVCADGAAYLVTDDRGISYFDESPAIPGIVIIDFWVLDVDGTTVMVDMFHTADAPRSLVAQAAAARESITLVTKG